MTNHDELPGAVRHFILQYIDSVELLRVLLLLHASRERGWRVEEITAELRSSPLAIEKRLKDLFDRGILSRDPATPGVFRYLPASPEMERAIDELASVNGRFSYRLIELIYSRPTETVRALADAFKIKRED